MRSISSEVVAVKQSRRAGPYAETERRSKVHINKLKFLNGSSELYIGDGSLCSVTFGTNF